MNNNNTSDLHTDHRQRMKSRFIETGGFESFSDHNILEMILFYSVPRKDTNELAHRLIDYFGSLREVFNASYDDLLQVNGITPNSAFLINMIPSLSKVYFDRECDNSLSFDSVDDIIEYLVPKYIGIKNEIFIMLALDNRGRIIKCSKISEGGINYTDVNSRNLIGQLISCNASNVVLSHNHPMGYCVPSKEDHEMTKRLSVVFNSINITLVDHIIVSGKESFSFRRNAKFSDCFENQPTERFADGKIIWG